MRRSVSAANLSDLVDRIYSCVDDDQRWTGVAEAVRESLPGGGVAIRVAAEPATSVSRFFYAGLQRNFVAPAHAGKIFNKPWMDQFLRLDHVSEEVLELDRLFDDTAFRRSGLTRAFLRPEEVFGSQVVMLGPDQGFRMTLVTRGDPILARWSSGLLNSLLPHLKRVESLRRLHRPADETTNLAHILDQLALGVVVIDAEENVVLANESATRLSKQGEAIAIGGDGRFRCRDEAAQRDLRAALARHGTLGATGEMAEPIVIGRRSSSGGPISISACALPRRGSTAHFVVYVQALDRAPSEAGILRLATLLGLTPAEQRLLRHLGSGQRLDDAAKALGVSPHTVGNQLRAIFEKAGVQRQIDLARLIGASGAHDLLN